MRAWHLIFLLTVAAPIVAMERDEEVGQEQRLGDPFLDEIGPPPAYPPTYRAQRRTWPNKLIGSVLIILTIGGCIMDVLNLTTFQPRDREFIYSASSLGARSLSFLAIGWLLGPQ